MSRKRCLWKCGGSKDRSSAQGQRSGSEVADVGSKRIAKTVGGFVVCARMVCVPREE